MMTIGLNRNNREAQHHREIKNVHSKAKMLGGAVPPFSFGAKELELGKDGEKEALEEFVEQWLRNPSTFLDFNNFASGNELLSVTQSIERSEQCYSFESFIDKSDKAKFFESKQPFYGTGEKIAFIILPHWNAYFHKYKHGTAFIRNCFLPVATYRYFPRYTTEDDFVGGPRYDIVGPNLGLTIKRFWQDVLNIQFFAEYLKTEFSYDKVGIWAYSIGSPRGYLASMFSNGLIDYLIMNFLADSFPEALLHGIGTEAISRRILENISESDTEALLSPLSPGKYARYLGQLPQHTRLVQSKYDLVFGEKNNQRMVELLANRAPFVEVEYGNFGHTTYGEIDKVFPIISRNSRFVLKSSRLRFLI